MLAVAIALPFGSKPGVRVTTCGVVVEKVTVPAGAVPLLGSVADVTTAVMPSGCVLPLLPVSSSGELRAVVVAAGVMVARKGPALQAGTLGMPEEKLASPIYDRVRECEPRASWLEVKVAAPSESNGSAVISAPLSYT